jgi:hypothetical protein
VVSVGKGVGRFVAVNEWLYGCGVRSTIATATADEVVVHGSTTRMFTSPKDERTERDVSGRFG